MKVLFEEEREVEDLFSMSVFELFSMFFMLIFNQITNGFLHRCAWLKRKRKEKSFHYLILHRCILIKMPYAFSLLFVSFLIGNFRYFPFFFLFRIKLFEWHVSFSCPTPSFNFGDSASKLILTSFKSKKKHTNSIYMLT